MRTLSCVLAGECGDDRLRDLFVESVQPAPDSTRLLVSIYPGPSAQSWNPDQVLESLHKAAGMLRSKIAAAIHRKRVPDLVYRLVPSADISQSEPPPGAW
jgi:ribosome-binding factor A